MILMVPNKHKESVALCIYHISLVTVIGFWNCWFSRKEENQQQNQLKHHIVSANQNMKSHLVGVNASTTTPLLFPMAYM